MLSSPTEHLGGANVPDRAKPPGFDTVAYIPARLASERVPRKNLRLLGDNPLISYASKSALRASSIDRVYVNTESSEIAAIAKTIGVGVYLRAARLAAGPVTTDEILYDFAKTIDCRTLVVINPTAPFLKPKTIGSRPIQVPQKSVRHHLIHHDGNAEAFCHGRPALQFQLFWPLSKDAGSYSLGVHQFHHARCTASESHHSI